jgi:hypothetical protein
LRFDRVSPLAALVAGLLIASLGVLKVHLSSPKITPDSKLFLAVADNVRLNGCLAYSDPQGEQCEPAWGSQPPGYSFFLAALRAFTLDPRAVIAAQVFVFTGAALWLSVSAPYKGGLELLGRVVLLLASPLTLAWGRWMLTETLATAASIGAFAVFSRALHANKASLTSLTAVLVAAMLIRWDQIWMLLPAVALLGLIESPREALRRALVLISIALVPYAALSVRAIAQGLPPVPTNTVDLDLPPGILNFWRSTALDQRATTGLIWPSWSGEYHKVRELALESVSGYIPRSELVALINQLSMTERGSPFPLKLDQGFDRLATRFTSEHLIYARVAVPLLRIMRIWTWPDKQFFSGWEGLSTSQSEQWRTAYRITLLFIAGLPLLGVFGPQLRRLSALLFLYVIGRTCFLVSSNLTMLETRYLVEFFSVMEFLAALVLGSLIGALTKKRARLSSRRYISQS